MDPLSLSGKAAIPLMDSITDNTSKFFFFNSQVNMSLLSRRIVFVPIVTETLFLDNGIWIMLLFRNFSMGSLWKYNPKKKYLHLLKLKSLNLPAHFNFYLAYKNLYFWLIKDRTTRF